MRPHSPAPPRSARPPLPAGAGRVPVPPLCHPTLSPAAVPSSWGGAAPGTPQPGRSPCRASSRGRAGCGMWGTGVPGHRPRTPSPPQGWGEQSAAELQRWHLAPPLLPAPSQCRSCPPRHPCQGVQQWGHCWAVLRRPAPRRPHHTAAILRAGERHNGSEGAVAQRSRPPPGPPWIPLPLTALFTQGWGWWMAWDGALRVPLHPIGDAHCSPWCQERVWGAALCRGASASPPLPRSCFG